MNKQDRKYLKRLLETPSPTGCEQRIASVVRERMEGCECPKCFEGFPIALVAASLISLAFLGFSGLKVW